MSKGDTVTWQTAPGAWHFGVLVGWTPSGKYRVRRYQTSTKKLGPIVTVDEVQSSKLQLFVDTVK